MSPWSRIVVAMVLACALAACVSVNSVTVFKASTSKDARSALSGDAVAVLAGGACIHVVDRGAAIKTLASIDYESPEGTFRTEIWVVPERGSVGFSVVPVALVLVFADGTGVEPVSVQVSRFRTRWETETTLLFKPSEYERIAHAQHEPAQAPRRTDAATALADWTRFVVEFPRPAEKAQPQRLEIRGLFKDGERIEVPPIVFTLTRVARVVYPGTWADGTSVWDTADKVCRDLQR